MKLYDFLLKIGEQSGCHRIPERSFFYKGKQFPVCARCTGGFIGYILGGGLYFVYEFDTWVLLLFCKIMFFDWLLQNLRIKESTNIRRLLTGILGGIGIVQMYFKVIFEMVGLIVKMVK